MAGIRIYHNVQQRDAAFGLNVSIEASNEEPGFKRVTTSRSHPLVKVFEFGIPRNDQTDTKLLDYIFEQFNIGQTDLAQGYRERQLRSLSVGDVVSINGRYYSCESAGWEDRSYDELNITTDFDPLAEYGVVAVTVPL